MTSDPDHERSRIASCTGTPASWKDSAMGLRLSIPTIAVLAIVTLPVPVSGETPAGFCEILFQFNAGSMHQLQRHEVRLKLQSGETRDIGQSRIDFVVNMGPNPLQAWLTGGPRSEISLRAGEREPEARMGYFFGPRPVRLDRLNCLPAVRPIP